MCKHVRIEHIFSQTKKAIIEDDLLFSVEVHGSIGADRVIFSIICNRPNDPMTCTVPKCITVYALYKFVDTLLYKIKQSPY